MEYTQYTIGYLRHSDNTEYQIRIYAESDEQAIKICRNKFQKFGEGTYYVVKEH